LSQANQQLYEFGPFRLDAEKRTLLRDGSLVPLAPKAFDLLVVLVSHSGQALEKDRLMEIVWPDSIVEEANLPQNISTLRKALGETPNERKYITTISGKGYKFAADVKELGGETEVVLERYSKATLIVEEQDEEKRESNRSREAKSLPAPELPAHFRWSSIRLMAVLSAGVVVSLTLYFALFRKAVEPSPPTAIQSFAVLPSNLLNADKDDEYLGIGLADALITRLSNLQEIIVRPTSSIRKYENQAKDPMEAGRELRVEAVLESSIQKAGERVRVTVRLVKVADGSSLWADKFDEQFTNIFALQDAIAERVAESLLVKLSGKHREELARHDTENSEAYDLYIRGRVQFNKLTSGAVTRAIDFFQQATEMDSDFALAHTGLADCYLYLAINSDAPPKEVYPKARAAAARALEIDSRLADAYAARGTVRFWFDWDWAEAERDFKRAIESNPNHAYAHLRYAHLLSNIGRHEEAITEAKRALNLEPFSLHINMLTGQFFYHMHNYDPAIEQTRKTLEIDPSFWAAHGVLGRTYAAKRMYSEAIAELQKALELSGGRIEAMSQLGYGYAVSGDRLQAEKILAELKKLSRQRYVPYHQIARIYVGLGKKDEALDALEKAFHERDTGLTFLKVVPQWNSLRADPRFQDLLRRVGFTL
jgi:DNA-binding winged helix-turn-helix (wHTH) protein/TolB-like protein/Tfp pilus assembly protein PilF